MPQSIGSSRVKLAKPAIEALIFEFIVCKKRLQDQSDHLCEPAVSEAEGRVESVIAKQSYRTMRTKFETVLNRPHRFDMPRYTRLLTTSGLCMLLL